MWARIRSNVLDLKLITIFETRRLVKSPKFVVSTLFILITQYTYLVFAAEASSLQSVLKGSVGYENGIMRAFVFIGSFLTSLLLIVFLTDLISGDRSLEFVWGATSDRWSIILGKLLAVLLGISLVLIMLDCELILVFWLETSQMISLSNQIMAIGLLIFFTWVAACFIILCCLFGRKMNSPGLGTQGPLFVFFVIPYLVYASTLYGFIDDMLLKTSYIYYLSAVTDFLLPPITEKVTQWNDYGFALILLVEIGIISFILSILLFSYLEE
ncbi:MAG: hypothetical protein ACFFCQ_02005 [Promethearchaeota archaeon]